MKLKEIKFSVVLPILERKDIVEGFPLAIESIFKNTLLPNQVVVVIDGLYSKSFKDMVLKYQKKYFLDLIWCNKKVGLDKALNLALTKCKNEIIFRADGDDINLNYRFEKQLPYLISGFDVVGSSIDEYDENGNYISTKKVPITNKDIGKLIPFRNPINHMTAAFLKKSVLEVNGYPELFLKGDYGLWIKLYSNNKKFINLEESLVKVSAGSRMIRDRGGLRYIYSEYLLQKFLLKHELTSTGYAIIIFILRSMVFSLPSFFRSFIYKKFLRNSN
nr:glycosyltransferase [Prochlorococcus marinus]